MERDSSSRLEIGTTGDFILGRALMRLMLAGCACSPPSRDLETGVRAFYSHRAGGINDRRSQAAFINLAVTRGVLCSSLPFGISTEESARKKEKESAGIRGDPRGMGRGGEGMRRKGKNGHERAKERNVTVDGSAVTV